MSGLPKGWATTTVGAVANYLNGVAFKPQDWGEAGFPIIRIQNLTSPEKAMNRTKKQVEEKYIVRKGDILVSWSATLDAFIWDREDAILNQHIFKVFPDERLVDQQFLFHGTRVAIRQMEESEHLHGSTMKHINRGPFLAHSFLLPPRPEQRRMVAKLDRLGANAKRARSDLDRIPALLTRAKQAILAKEFAPASETSTELTDFVADGLIGLVRSKAEQSDQGTPYIRMQHFDLDGAWNANDLTAVLASEAEKEKFSLIKDDMLFNTRNSFELVGKVALVPKHVEGFLFNNNLLRLRFKKTILPAFAFRQMQAPIFRNFLQQQKSATTSVAAIYQGTLMRTPFWVPAISEQKAIVRRIESAFAKIDRIATETALASKLLVRLDQTILAKAFRGELVPQDPNDEPAEKLLARIKAERHAASKPKKPTKAAT